MSKSTLSAQQTRRYVTGYRRNAALAASLPCDSPERNIAERLCGRIAQRLSDGGRPDIASNLFAETLRPAREIAV